MEVIFGRIRDWVLTRDPGETYDYWDTYRCPVATYSRETGDDPKGLMFLTHWPNDPDTNGGPDDSWIVGRDGTRVYDNVFLGPAWPDGEDPPEIHELWTYGLLAERMANHPDWSEEPETEVTSRTDLLTLVLDYGDACATAAAFAKALDQRGDDGTVTLKLRVQEKEDSRKEIESRLRALITSGTIGPPQD